MHPSAQGALPPHAGGAMALLMSLKPKDHGAAPAADQGGGGDDPDMDGDDDSGEPQSASTKYTIPIPEGWSPPHGVQPGAKFPMSATWMLSEDGKSLVVESIENIPTGASAPESAEEAPEPEDEEAGEDGGGGGDESEESPDNMGDNQADEPEEAEPMAEAPGAMKGGKKGMKGKKKPFEKDSAKALMMAMKSR